MRKTAAAFFAVYAALAARGTMAAAAERTILGRTLAVKNPTGANEKRKIVGVAKELGSPDMLVGDPTLPGMAGGAILQVTLDGTTPSVQSFVLAQGTDASGRAFWSGSATTAFQYKDVEGEQGPVKTLKLKRSASGVFLVKAVIHGANGTVDLVPPNPGTGGCLAVQLGLDASGDRYSVQFGSDGQVVNQGSTLFKVVRPVQEGVCPGGVTTTTTSTTVPTTSSTSTTTSTSSTSSTSTTSSTSSSSTSSTSTTTSTSSTTSSTTSTSTTSSTSSTTSTSTTSSTSSTTSTTLPPLPAKISAAGDSITQGFAADCTNVICVAAGDKPQYSWFNGTHASVNSVHKRYLALDAGILSQRESVSGAEMRGSSNSFAAQAGRMLTEVPVPDHVEVLLGGNDICNRDCVDGAHCGNPVYTDTQWRDAVRAGLDQLVAGLPLGSTIYLLGVPRVQDLREVGLAKSAGTCETVWSLGSVCRIITNGGTLSGESYAVRRAGVAERQQRYNEILRDEAAAYNANTTGQNPRGIEVVADYVDEATPSVGTATFEPADIDGGDCFHPSIVGQDKLAFGAWENNPDHP